MEGCAKVSGGKQTQAAAHACRAHVALTRVQSAHRTATQTSFPSASPGTVTSSRSSSSWSSFSPTFTSAWCPRSLATDLCEQNASSARGCRGGGARTVHGAAARLEWRTRGKCLEFPGCQSCLLANVMSAAPPTSSSCLSASQSTQSMFRSITSQYLVERVSRCSNGANGCLARKLRAS